MKKCRFFKKLNNKGFTFVECICAIALFAIIGTMAFSMFSNATRYLSNAKKEELNNTEAQKLFAQDSFSEGDAIEGTAIYKHSHITTAVIQGNNVSAQLYYLNITYTVSSGEKITMTSPVNIVRDATTNQPILKADQESLQHGYYEYTTADGRKIKVLAEELVTESDADGSV